MLARVGIVLAFGVLGLVACSEAESPIIDDSGVVAPPGPEDAGDGQTGDRDEPCNPNNTCDNANTLVCVNDPADNIAKCRLLCDPDAQDPCGDGQNCIGLVDAGDSVCAPPLS
jgi:hypothetical protein